MLGFVRIYFWIKDRAKGGKKFCQSSAKVMLMQIHLGQFRPLFKVFYFLFWGEKILENIKRKL